MTDPCSSFRIEFIWQKPEKAGRFVSILRSYEAAERGAVSHVVIDTFETRESGRKGEFGTLAACRFGL